MKTVHKLYSLCAISVSVSLFSLVVCVWIMRYTIDQSQQAISFLNGTRTQLSDQQAVMIDKLKTANANMDILMGYQRQIHYDFNLFDKELKEILGAFHRMERRMNK